MSMMIPLVRFGVVAALASVLGACVVESDRHHRSRHGSYGDYGDDYGYEDPPPPATSAGGTGGTPAPAPSPTTPMLVEVDTDQTMTADPGQGVGVFVEYGSGGKWHIWWTCDTAKTNKDCAYDISVTSASGPLANIDTSALSGGFAVTPDPTRLDASVRTSGQVHGIRFDTAPGGVITLEASVSGIKDGSFLFFVQNGQVNGGYTGVLTNPLQLQGKSP